MLSKLSLFVIMQTTFFIEIITLDMDILEKRGQNGQDFHNFNYKFKERRPAPERYLHISLESCRFELHTSSLSWDEAYQACKQRGMTLASLSDELELLSLSTVMLQANQMHSQQNSLETSKYWVGLRMGIESQQFHWGDCTIDPSITRRFSTLNYDMFTTACGFIYLNSLLLTHCYTNQAMGFICELPSGSGPCFTTLSTMPSMGYDSTCVLASSLCASSCLSESSCAGIYVSRETECTLLTYKSQMSWSLAASDLQSTHIFHKGLFYQSSYYQFQEGLTENELCLIPIASPIVTTQIPGEITTGQINPTPALNTRETDTHLETASDSCSNSSLDCIAQLRTLSTSEEQGAAQTSQVDNLATDSLNMIMNLNNQSSTVNNSSALSVVFDNNASTLNTSEVTLFTVHSEDTEFTTLAAKINPYTQTIEVKAPDDNGIFGTSNNTLLLHISTIDNIATLSITDIPHTQIVADSTLDDNGPLNTFYSTSLLYTSSTDSIMNSDNDSSMISVVNSSQNFTTGYLNAKEDMPLFNSSICFCICKETTENLQEKLKKISLNLKLDTASLSSVLRRKVSADDPRPSVRYVGSFGLVVLFLCAAVIICCDSLRFMNLFRSSNRKVLSEETTF